MTHRIRIATTARLMAAAVTVLVLSPAAAVAAGPSHAAPSELPLSAKRAHRVAVLGQRYFLASVLPGGAHARVQVGRCTGGPMVWSCPGKITADDTTCTATIKVWRGKESFYVEDQHLRCR